MRGDAKTMTFLRPKTPKQAVRLFGKTPAAIPLAGGTDIMVHWNAGRLNNKTILDLSAIKDWKGIRAKPNSLLIGALATHKAIYTHPAVLKRFPLLAEACAEVGAEQIQNRGTLGGNIANASPAGDTFPALALYEPVIHTLSPKGPRAVPLMEIFTGVKKTVLRPAELITAVELPFLAGRPARRLFRKVGTRAAQAISKTVGAGLLWLGKNGTVKELRFAFGSVAPTVRRLKTVEAYLAGQKLVTGTIAEACGLLSQDIAPIDDIRSTRLYRLEVSRNILRDFLSR